MIRLFSFSPGFEKIICETTQKREDPNKNIGKFISGICLFKQIDKDGAFPLFGSFGESRLGGLECMRRNGHI